MRTARLVVLLILCGSFVSAQPIPVVRMGTDQHVTFTFTGAPSGAPRQWSLVDPAVPIAPGQAPFRVAYIVTFAPSVDGQVCLVTPKGLTPVSPGLGTWEVQVRAGGQIVGRITLVIAPPGGETGIEATAGSVIVASGLTR